MPIRPPASEAGYPTPGHHGRPLSRHHGSGPVFRIDWQGLGLIDVDDVTPVLQVRRRIVIQIRNDCGADLQRRID